MSFLGVTAHYPSDSSWEGVENDQKSSYSEKLDIITKLPEVKVAVVQCDQAGGHGGGRSEMKKVIAELNEFGKPFPKPIHFITQCSR